MNEIVHSLARTHNCSALSQSPRIVPFALFFTACRVAAACGGVTTRWPLGLGGLPDIMSTKVFYSLQCVCIGTKKKKAKNCFPEEFHNYFSSVGAIFITIFYVLE